jgi:hypothetical protein
VSDDPPPIAVRADRDLLAYLRASHVDAVQQVVSRFTLGAKPAKSLPKLLAQVEAVLTDAAALDRLIASLTPLEREVLTTLKRHRGTCDAWQLATHLALRGFRPSPVPKSVRVSLSWLGGAGANDYAAALLADGLLFRVGHSYTDYDAWSRHDPRLFSDPRLLARLPSTAERAPTQLALPVAEGAKPTAPHPMALVLELLSSLQVVHDLGGLQLNRDSTINRNFVRRAVRERPERAGSLERSFHWLYGLGWVKRDTEDTGGGARLPLPVDKAALLSTLSLAPAAVYGMVVESLVHAGDGLVTPDWTVGRFHPAPRSAVHLALIESLALLPDHPFDARAAADRIWEGVLVRVFGWQRSLGHHHTDFQQRPPAVLALLTRSCVRAGLLASDHPFDSAAEEGVGLAPTLGTRWYRAWAEAAQQHHDRPGVMSALQGVSIPDEGPALIIGANFEVLVYLDRLTSQALALLMATTIRRIDAHTATATLDRASFNRALALGGETESILAGLTEHAGSIPRNVEQSLRDWAGRRERVRVTLKTRLLEFPDAVARDAALARYAHARAVGDRFLLLGEGRPALTEAEVQGLAPRVTGRDYRTRSGPHLQFRPNGQVQVEGTPDLVTRALLGGLTRVQADGSCWLDREALRTFALPGAWRTLLKERMRNPLAPHLEALMEAWGGEASAPGLDSATLFTHPNATAWAQHPSLAPFLRHPLNAQTYLVDAGAVASLRAALLELGLNPGGSLPATAAPKLATASPPGGPRLLEGLSTRRVRELLEAAIAAGGEVELRYAVERERYDGYGRVARARGRTRTRTFHPLEIQYRGSLPYLVATPAEDGEEELIRVGYIEAIALTVL